MPQISVLDPTRAKTLILHTTMAAYYFIEGPPAINLGWITSLIYSYYKLEIRSLENQERSLTVILGHGRGTYIQTFDI